MTHPQEYFTGKVVLVTGAGGSIGSEICRRLISLGVRGLRMVGHSEQPLYELTKVLQSYTLDNINDLPGRKVMFGGKPHEIVGARLKCILASTTDGKAMAAACEGVDIVIHAAAHKHVPLCEQNPIEAIQNNVGGTIELAQAAGRQGVKQFVLVSSDKAVKPSSVMGATKRACELFVNFLSTRSSTKFTTVRFGNVLNSSGSVLPLWREQILQGKPITLTDKRCTRYFMSIPEAIDLTLNAATLPRGGTFVLDMGKPHSLYDMACDLVYVHCMDVRSAGLSSAASSYDSHITITGLRPGEKLEEELSYGGEQVKTAFPKVFALREDGARHILRWDDFSDLLMAARCRHKQMALEKLWEIVR